MAKNKKIGRPTKYTQNLAAKICAGLADGKSLRTVCEPDDMPDKSTVFNWLHDNQDFLDQYTRAKEESADLLVDEMLAIADDGSNDLMTIGKGDKSYEIENKEVTNRSKLRVETRKWIASKLKPKKYGDKIDHTTNGKDLPTPILGYVSSDNSNAKDHADEKTDTRNTRGNVSKQNSKRPPLLDSLGAK